MKKVLLVEDDEFGRYALRELLSDAAFDVAEADNGLAARRMLEGDTFDLVVTDIFMPDMDGIELIRLIRKTYPDVKILALSGGGAGFTPGYATDLASTIGANAALQKPVSNDELRAALDAIFRDEDGKS